MTREGRDARDAPRSQRVLLAMTLLLLPAIIAARLPLVVDGAVLLVLLVVLFVTRRRPGPWGTSAGLLLTAIIAGTALSLLWRLPSFWALLAPVGLLGGWWLQAKFEQRLGIKSRKAGLSQVSRPAATERVEVQWRERAGHRVRLFDQGEIAMGGPTFCSWLFDDGVLLTGVGESWCFSADGRYFAAVCPSRQGDGLLLLDREQDCVFYQHATRFWRLHEVSELYLTGQSRSASEEELRMPLATIMAAATARQLISIGDIKVEAGEWQQLIAREYQPTPCPSGAHRVTARFHLPPSLRSLEHPLQPLYRPAFELLIDDEPQDVVVGADEPLVWRADGVAFACAAQATAQVTAGVAAGRSSSGYWLWTPGLRWQPLPHPWWQDTLGAGMFGLELAHLEADSVVFRACLLQPKLSQGRYGLEWGRVAGGIDYAVGHDAEGRARVAEYPAQPLNLSLPLGAQGHRQEVALIYPDADRPLRFEWYRDLADGAPAYRCRAGDEWLKGDFLCVSRLSADGRYLALLPAPATGQVASALGVVDLHSLRLMEFAPIRVKHLLGFNGSRLDVLEVRGISSDDRRLSPLHPWRRASQPADAALGATSDDEVTAGRHYCLRRSFEVGTGELTPLPDYRLVDRPQLACCDDDFVYPSPDNRDAAWLFGAVTRFDDGYLRAGKPRTNGKLLTASGCVLGGLAPAMIWSADGRYLALTRKSHDAEGGERPWFLLLLEPATGLLRHYAEPLGNMPRFGSFDAAGLYFFVHRYGWLAEGDPGRSRRLDWAYLLAPDAEALLESGDLKMMPAEYDDADLWQALDRSPLESWRALEGAR